MTKVNKLFVLRLTETELSILATIIAIYMINGKQHKADAKKLLIKILDKVVE